MRKLLVLPVLLLSLLLANSASSADFQIGLDAHKSGDFATAQREWTPLAGQGERYARAQSDLGLMYCHGFDVLQGYKIAVKWYRLVAQQGHVDVHMWGNIPRPMEINWVLSCEMSLTRK